MRATLRSWGIGALIVQAAALAYLAAGKPGFEPRLAVGPWSANQFLQVVVMGAAAVACARLGPRFAAWPRTLGFVLALVALLLLGMSQSVNRGYAADKAVGFALVVLPAMLVLAHWTRDAHSARRALAVWACAGGLMMLVGVAMLLAGKSPARLAVLGGGANVYARMVASALVAGIGVAGLCLRGWRGAAEVALLGGSAAALLFAGSKAVVVALGIALAVQAFALGRPWRAAACVVGALLFAGAPIVLDPLVRGADKHRGEVRMFQQPDLADPEGSYTTRLQFVEESARLIGERGLLGVGTGDWGPAVGRAGGRTYPHNWFLELWTELGLAGLAFAVLVPVWCFTLARRVLRTPLADRPLAATALALAVFWFLNAQASGDVLDNRNLWWSVLLLEVAAMHAAARVVPAVLRPASAARA